MTETIKLPRKLSEERKPPPPQRPSHADVIENLDRWANSPGLQPPTSVRREESLSREITAELSIIREQEV